ncbi:MAG: hypothetical protein RLZZ621_1286 [Gemmatimonadota bacterium]
MSEPRLTTPTPPTATLDEPLLAGDPAEAIALDPLLDTGTTMWAVIFAGGIGTRFWPLSTPKRPKPLLALVNERPLLADTVARLAPLIPADRVLVVTSADIAETLHAAISEVPKQNMLIEPRPLGTAAALAWGAQEVARRAGPDAVFCAMHADLAVGYPDVLRTTLRRAGSLAAAEPVLITLGAPPTRAETGFGYLQPGMPLDPLVSRAEGGTCRVEHFVEKPHAALADVLIDKGALWNTGIFVWRARIVLEELAAHTPEIAQALTTLEAGDLATFAQLVTSVSIDRGLLERSARVVVIPSEFAWDDVGTWASLRRVRELDDTGNGVMGHVHCIDASGNVIHADGGCVVVYGVSGMIVVSIDGLTFVTSLEKATDLAPLLNALPGSLRFNPGRS